MSRPNCLLFVIDSLRYDHTNLGGYHRNTTPNLLKLAKDAVTYTNFHTVATWTRPVASSLLSGVYPPVHKVRHRDSTFAYNGPRLPTVLQNAGYETTAFSGIGQVSSFAGFSEGFTSFQDVYRDETILARRTSVSERDAKILEEGVGSRIALVRTEDLVGLFQDWWRSRTNTNTPFFSLIWSLDPHPPFEPPREFLQFGDVEEREYTIDAIRRTNDYSGQIKLYDGEILYTDHWIGKLVEFLHKVGAYDDTMLIFVADHGEAWGEHGFVGHGQAPYQELLHVPLIIKYPSGKYGGTKVNDLADMTDLVPTIISELLGKSDLEDLSAALQGLVLRPLQLNQPWSRRASYSDSAPTPFQPSYLSIRTPEWKAIVTSRGLASSVGVRKNVRSLLKLMSGTNLWREFLKHPFYFLKKYATRSLSSQGEELYHLLTDPIERQNQRNSAHETYADLRAELNKWLDTCELLAESVPEIKRDFEADSVMHQHLKALGYID